jgi:hypothetical protein
LRRLGSQRWFFLVAAGPLALGLLGVLSSCGDDGPTGIDTSRFELVLVQGDLQSAEAGTELPVPLQVRLQTLGNAAAVEDVEVRWEVLDGSGASLNPTVSETSSLGLAETRLTLGPDLGTYRVLASVRGMDSGPVEFSAMAIPRPSLDELSPSMARPGDTLLLTGTNFSATPLSNIVSFSRVRAEVLTSGATELRVVVPPCLVPREYDVRVQVGALVTDPERLSVQGNAESLALDVGADVVIDPASSFACLHLPYQADAEYLVVPHSTGTVSEAEYGYSLVTLTQDGISPNVPRSASDWWAARVPPAEGRLDEGRRERTASAVEAQDRWDEVIRGLEAERLAEWKTRRNTLSLVPASQKRTQSSSKTPEVGDRRRFNVLNAEKKFDQIYARLRYVSDRSLVYMDEDAPPGGFSDSDLSVLALEFQAPIHPTVTGAFGSESDLDGNDRVIILFTPAVNRLSGGLSDGYVGGFFYGLDLMEGLNGSNEGEIFYAMVPDPNGHEGTVISRSAALSAIPAVLAHEFEHMVHFNRRMLLGNAENIEALWLSEALAQMAEDLVATEYQRTQHRRKAEEFRIGNWIRAGRFLEETSQVSVLASLPPGTLAERGAGWLLIKQLAERQGKEGLLADLAASTLTGTENLTTHVGLGWQELMADWTGALFLDGLDLPTREELEVGGIDLRTDLARPGGVYPLQPFALTEGSTLVSGSLWSSAPKYFIISPPAGGAVISAGGPMGGPLEPGLGLRLLVVRLR